MPSGVEGEDALRSRIAELEAQVKALEKELKEKTTHADDAKHAHAAISTQLQAEIEAHKALKATHAEHAKTAEEVKDAIEKENSGRLAAQAAETATRHAVAISEAVQAKENELAAKHADALRERFEAGREEAGLRFKLLDARKTAQLTALQKQVEQLEAGQSSSANVEEAEEISPAQNTSADEPHRRSSRKRANSTTSDASQSGETKRIRQSQRLKGKPEASD